MKKTTDQLLRELSILSRETLGGTFVIAHRKDSGRWKVVFTNAMVKNDCLQETSFQNAIQNAIDWLRKERKTVDKPTEKYTLFRTSL